MRNLLLLVLISLLGGPLCAQEGKITADDLATLLDFGFGDTEVLGVLKKPGKTLDLKSEDLPRLEKKGAGSALISYLKARLPKPARAVGLSPQEVIDLWKKSGNAAEIEKRIIDSDSQFELGIEDFLAFSRARLPYRLIALMKKRRAGVQLAKKSTRPVSTHLELDDLVRLTRDGMSEKDILERIRSSPKSFEVSTEDILRLEREGVSLAVLREVFARRSAPRTPSAEAGAKDGSAKNPPRGATKPGMKSAEPALETFTPKGGAFSMLRPSAFITNERFTGRKMLVQMVDASAAEREDLPDLELSVLVGRTREREREGLTHANLEPMADKLMKSVAAGFRKDGIVYVTRKPQALHLAGKPALRYPTTATTASGTGHVGASFVLFAGNQVLVISYSARQELSAVWRDRLEICARSLTLRDARPTLDDHPALASARVADDLRRRFEIWRDSIRSFDYASFAAISPEAANQSLARRLFVERALALEGNRNRLEFDAVNLKTKELHYNVFGIDGKKKARLGIVDGADGQPRLRSR